MISSHNPVALVLSDKNLIPLYFEERKSIALSDGTILTSDFDAKKIQQISDYIKKSKTLNGGALYGKPTTVKKAKASEIEHYLSQLESESSGNSNANMTDSEPSKRLHEYLQSGVEKWCSDIHIEVHENSTVIYARVDGRRILLSEIPDRTYGEQLFSFIFNSKATEKDSDFVPKDANNGHVEEILMCSDIVIIDDVQDIRKVKRKTSWRVAYVPAKRGGRCTFRWLDANSEIPKLDDMGWTAGHVAVLRGYRDMASGVCIISGKTGSGKTTALASALNEIPAERSVVTLEDPPEFNLRKAIQIQIKPNTPVREGGDEMRGFNYYSKQTLRHDVDVEMHGEVRDKVGAMELTRKGETGQLMFTTLHTSSALGIGHTLTEQMHVPAAVIAAPALMRLWIYQTLVRKVCPHCCLTAVQAAEHYKDQQDCKVAKWLNQIDELCKGETKNARFRNPNGCKFCVEGERGRTALVEMIVLDDEDREYIIKKDNAGWLKALKAKGFKDVRDHAISKIKSGTIDVVTASGKVNDLLPVDSADTYKTFEM